MSSPLSGTRGWIPSLFFTPLPRIPHFHPHPPQLVPHLLSP